MFDRGTLPRILPLALLLVLSLILTGCASTSQDQIKSDAPMVRDEREWRPADAVQVGSNTSSLDQDASWGTLVVDATGAPGSWLVVSKGFSTPSPRVEFEVRMSAKAEGDGDQPLGLLVAAPQVTVEGNGTLTSDVRLFVDRAGTMVEGDFEERLTFRMLSGENLTSLYFAVGSTGRWSLNTTVTLGPGPTTGPDFVANGTNARLAVGIRDEPTLTESSGGIRSELALQPSWSHMEMYWTPLINESVNPHLRRCDLSFGYGSMQCTTADSRPDYTVFGRAVAEPGLAFLDLDYAIASSRFDVAIFTIPMGPGDWPEDAGHLDYLQAKGDEQ